MAALSRSGVGAIIGGMPKRDSGKRERSLYEIASSFFAVCVIVFAVAGMLAAAFGDEGVVSAGFAICALFLLLGVGRLYLGLVRGSEGAEGE